MSSTRRLLVSLTRLASPYPSSQICSSYTRILKHQSLNQGLGCRYFRTYTRTSRNHNAHRRKFSVYNNSVPKAPILPSSPPQSYSLKWILGASLAVVGPLLKFKNDVETAVEGIEEIVDVVEKVAEVVDKVAEGISDDLPEGGKFKEMLDHVEDVAEKIAKNAHTVGDAIDKFQEVEGKVDSIVEIFGDEADKHPKKT